MRHLMIILGLLLSGPVSANDRIATGSPFADGIKVLFSQCAKCMEMEKLRKEVFVDTINNSANRSKIDNATAKIKDVKRFGRALAKTNPQARGPHFNDEMESFFILAVDAMPFTEDYDIPEMIARFNDQIPGAKAKFERVMADMSAAGCRRDFLFNAVKFSECEEAGKTTCRAPMTIVQCENRKAR